MCTKLARRTLAAAAALLMLATLTGCRPDNIFLSVENRAGGTLHHVKVSYPDGKLTFRMIDVSSTAGTFRHFDGPGELAISYTTEDGHTYNSSGPRVTGNEKGEVDISIDGSYANFDTKFEESKE